LRAAGGTAESGGQRTYSVAETVYGLLIVFSG